jgi:hypothetical protein
MRWRAFTVRSFLDDPQARASFLRRVSGDRMQQQPGHQ